MQPNLIRGEVAASIGALKLVLALDMAGLAKIGAATGYPPLSQLYARFSGAEPATVLAALEHCIVGGEVDGRKLPKPEAYSQAIARMTIDDMMALQGPLQGLLAALMRPAPEGPRRGNRASGRNR